MTKPVRVLGPRDPKEKNVINTTSNSPETKEFSPFYLGPCKVLNHFLAIRMENAWQYSKVYKCHVDKKGNPSKEWYEWAYKGWDDPKAHRYPMGKGAKPLYSYWDGKKLDYIAARLHIYIPLYAKLVKHTDSFKKLKKRYKAGEQITLWDFDGYDHIKKGYTLTDVVFDPHRKMGHAFVLAMLLEKHPLVALI